MDNPRRTALNELNRHWRHYLDAHPGSDPGDDPRWVAEADRILGITPGPAAPMSMNRRDGLPGVEGLSEGLSVALCRPPFVPVPKPGPCKGWKTPEFRERRARARQATIDDTRRRADVLAELEELANNEMDADAIGRSMRRFVDAAGLQDDEQVSALVRVAQRGDRAGLDKALGRLARRFGVRRVGGRAGETAGFDPAAHEMIAGERRPAKGTRVDVVRPGYLMRLDGKVVSLMKAVVEPAD